MKAVLSGKFITFNAYLKKEKCYKINNLSFHYRTPEKEQIKFKISRKNK